MKAVEQQGALIDAVNFCTFDFWSNIKRRWNEWLKDAKYRLIRRAL